MTRINIKKTLPANKPQGSIDVIDLGLPSALRSLLNPPARAAAGPRTSRLPNPRLYPGPEVSKKGRRLMSSGSLALPNERRRPEAKSPALRQNGRSRGRPNPPSPSPPHRAHSVPPVARRRPRRARRHRPPPRISPRLYRPPPPRRPPPAPRSAPRPWAPPPPEAPAHTASDFAILFAETRFARVEAAGGPERRAPYRKPAAVAPRLPSGPPPLGCPGPAPPRYSPQSLHFRWPQRPLPDFSAAAAEPPPSPRRAMATAMLDDSSDGNDTLSAPSEFLAEFLSAIMCRRYVAALRYCRLILQYEPHNPTARSFFPLLLQKTQCPDPFPRTRTRSPTPSRSSGSSSSASSGSLQSLSLDSSPSGSGRSSPASPAVDLIPLPSSKTDTHNYMPTLSLDDDDADPENETLDLLMEPEVASLRARYACCAIK